MNRYEKVTEKVTEKEEICGDAPSDMELEFCNFPVVPHSFNGVSLA